MMYLLLLSAAISRTSSSNSPPSALRKKHRAELTAITQTSPLLILYMFLNKSILA